MNRKLYARKLGALCASEIVASADLPNWSPISDSTYIPNEDYLRLERWSRSDEELEALELSYIQGFNIEFTKIQEY